jgi:hypothetical protein
MRDGIVRSRFASAALGVAPLREPAPYPSHPATGRRSP